MDVFEKCCEYRLGFGRVNGWIKEFGWRGGVVKLVSKGVLEKIF